MIADYDPESQGYTEDEEDGNLPLMMEDRPQSSSMYSAPILLSGLETESALANLSNKENNSPMFQSQVWMKNHNIPFRQEFFGWRNKKLSRRIKMKKTSFLSKKYQLGKNFLFFAHSSFPEFIKM